MKNKILLVVLIVLSFACVSCKKTVKSEIVEGEAYCCLANHDFAMGKDSYQMSSSYGNFEYHVRDSFDSNYVRGKTYRFRACLVTYDDGTFDLRNIAILDEVKEETDGQ